MSRQVAMISRLGKVLSLAVVTAAVFLASPQPANALLVTFKLLDASDADGPPCDGILYVSEACGNSTFNPAPYMFADVTETAGGDVSFKFYWGGDLELFFGAAPEAEMKQIYWDDQLGMLSNIAVDLGGTSPGVSFSERECDSPPACTLGGGNLVGFNPADFEAKADAGSDTGINILGPGGVVTSEMLEVVFAGSFAAVQGALVNNTLRIGIHAQSLPGGGDNDMSDGFISMAMLEVPEPATTGSIAIGLAGIAWLRRRKARA